MRPLRLEIQGLTSFRAPQEIDFSGLDLFVITGPTGAGKTSVLDAVAFALYGEVPRTGKRNAADLVTHGDTRARILLEFQADGKTYRVARQLPRNGAQKAQLERREGSDWVPEVDDSGVRPINARLEEIIGLTFEGFTRAVLLPQGDFAMFLRGDARERREILVRLLDLGRYERAGQLARERANLLGAEVANKEQLIEHEYGDATAESVAAAVAEADEAERRAAELERLRGDVQRAAGALADVERQLGEIGRDSATLAATTEKLAELERSWVKLAPEAKKLDQLLRRAGAELELAEKEFRNSASALERTRARTGDEDHLAELEEAALIMAQEDAAIGDLAQKMGSAGDEIAELERRLGEGAIVLESAEAQSRSLEKAQHEIAAEAPRVADDLRRARDRVVAEKAVAAASTKDAAARAEQTAAEQALGAAEAEATRDGEHLDHVRLGHAAVMMRETLTVGQPCPVCNNLVGAIPRNRRDTDAAIKAATAEAEVARKAVRAAQARFNDAVSGAKVAGERHRDARKVVSQVDGAPAIEAAEAAVALAETRRRKLQADRDKAAKVLDKVRRLHTELTSKLAGTRERRDGFAREHKVREKRLRMAETLVAGAFPDGIPNDVVKVIAASRRDLRSAREAAEKARARWDQAREAHTQATKARDRLLGVEQQLMKGCAEQRGILGHLTPVRDRADLFSVGLPVARPAVADEIRALNEWAGSIAGGLDSRRKAKENERQAGASELARVAGAMGIAPAAAVPANAERAAHEAVSKARLAAQRAGDRQSELKRKLAKRKELEEGIAAARDLGRLNRALADELRQNRFLDYVLAESMRQLATLASEELRGISAGRYSLLAEETSFLVIDHANADETRSVETLSGGETFLASLSLAIALGRSITDIAGHAVGSRLEAMFIDEGFGTLDAETLDVVIDALERLRDSDRMVGVITHVTQLAERIPDGLMVERDGSTSRVRRR